MLQLTKKIFKEVEIMKSCFRLMVALIVAVSLQADWKSVGHELPTGSDTTNSFGESVSLGLTYKAVGAPDENAVYVYKKDGEDWTEISKITNPTEDCNYIGGCSIKKFGYSVSLDEDSSNPNLLVIGAPASNNAGIQQSPGIVRGAFCTYTISGDTVSQLGECIVGDSEGNLGHSLDVSNYYEPRARKTVAYLVVGNPDKEMDGNAKQGQAEFYNYNAATGAWEDKTTATVQTPSYYARFGWSVSIYENEILIGAWGADADDNEKGLVFVHYTNGVWQETIALDANFGNYLNFGKSVDIYGDNMIVAYDMTSSGVYGDDTQKGRVSIYKRENTVWEMTNYIHNTTDSIDDGYGTSVSINDNYAVVGAPTNTYETPGDEAFSGGGAFIYEKDENDDWNLIEEINSLHNSKFGQSVSVYGENVMVGASGAQATTTYEYYEPVKVSPSIMMYLLN